MTRTRLEKLRDLLRELFQLDQADLDFGIYRIMNQKRDDVERFLDKDLLPQVRTAFEKYRPADKAALQTELDKLIAGINAAGMNPEESPKVKELRKRLTKGVDVAALEDEVFSDLFTFFRRYYHGGDFLSLRRYKEGVYAIPYEGEEVKLHWANHDQYYIKSSEHLTNYAFKVGPEGKQRRVRFELVEASAERDNNKAQDGNERRFIVADEDPVIEDGGNLVVRFEYRPDADKRKQDALNAEAASRVFAALADLEDGVWRDVLSRKVPTKASPDRTLLDKHLRTYTARNTFDYFIHKDLGGFLKRELDFFIKNEVLLLDDIDQVENFAKVEEKLSKIRVLRAIAHKIIAFLGQLEDFQKKLWLKKKFVVETNWCITLDRIPEEFYPEIAANDAQREEWVRLFAIDEIEGDLHTPVYVEPLTVKFLKANPLLVMDTRFFDHEFIDKLINSIEDIEGQCDGLLIHSENFQALSLIQARYRRQVKCIYIDPPYNTGSDDFPYKDGFKASSWFSMMDDRAKLASYLLSKQGLYFLQIGDDESARSRLVLEGVFPERKNSVVVRRGVKNVQAQFSDIDRLNQGHDTIHVCALTTGLRIPHLRQRLLNGKPGKWDTFWRGTDRPTMRYELFGQNPETGQWRWEKNRANRASEEYERYLRNEAEGKELDEWYAENLQAGVDLDFIRLNDEGVVQYYVPPQDFRLVSDNWLDIPSSGSETDFAHEKSLSLLRRVIQWNTDPGDWVLDYFAGSGSTSHATINFGVGKNRRHIAIEMGDYFNSTLLPRIKRIAYSSDWKDGKPVSRQGISQAFKYIRLESYEDALDNLQLRERSGPQQQLLAASPDAREDYMLSYMLDIETEGSASLLNIEQFKNPFDYKLKVTRNNETKVQTVDLVETFNYLIGLRVEHMAARVHRTADFERDEHKRLQVKGTTKPCKAGEGWTFRMIQGRAPSDDRVLVIWRVLTDDPEKDNLMLDTFCMKMVFSKKDMEFDLIYVNGDNNLENLRRDEGTWKVQLIEESFHRLMFDVRDV